MSDIKIENPKIKEIIAALAPALHGKDEVLTRLLACIFAGGHVLLEDLPGLGKTTLALAVARVLGGPRPRGVRGGHGRVLGLRSG